MNKELAFKTFRNTTGAAIYIFLVSQIMQNGDKLFGSDYTYKTTAGIVANDSIIIPMNEFTKGDGTRFDSYSIKAKNIFISCNVGANLRTGYFTISE